MKKKAIMLLFLALLLIPAQPARAQQNPAGQILEDTLREAADVRAPGFDFAETARRAVQGNLDLSFEGVLNFVTELLFKEVRSNMTLLIKMVVLSVLAGVLCNLQQAKSGEGVAEISFLACFAVIAALSVTILSGLMEIAVSTIDSLTLFMQSLMPVMGSLVMSASNAAFSGFYPVLFLSMQGFVYVCKSIFLPMIMVITALSVINAMSGRFHISRLIDFARQAVKWGVGLLLTIFVGVLTAQGFAASFAGGVAGRTMKYALSNFVPLVGSILAESAEAVVSSVRMIKGAVGLSGVTALIVLSTAPLLKMLAVSISYRFAAGVAEPATDNRIVKLLMELAGNMTLILVIVLMVCVMFIISIALLCTLIV